MIMEYRVYWGSTDSPNPVGLNEGQFCSQEPFPAVTTERYGTGLQTREGAAKHPTVHRMLTSTPHRKE